jgi:hypothetical protein
MVKKEDMVVVSAQEQRVVGDGKQLELFQENVILPGGESGSGCFGEGAISIARDCLTIKKL